MRNLEIANIFKQISDLLEIQDANPFRIRAYRRAAMNLEGLTDNIDEIARRDDLKEIPGIGADLAGKIREYLETQKIETFEELKKQIPIGLVQITAIPGVGPKTARLIHNHFKIRSIEELEKLAHTEKLLELKGIKQKSVDNILRGIELYRRKRGSYLLGHALPAAREICGVLESVSERVTYAGSLRRMKETVHDIDILAAATNAEAAMNAFLSLPLIERVLARGPAKCSVLLKDDLQIDLRVVEPVNWGAALVYFTGSKAHNIRLRERALKRGFKLNEYGLFDEKDRPACGGQEQDVYKALDLPYIPPVLREDLGEIEAADAGRLPHLVDMKDIRGDLHMHTTWSDGSFSIEEMVNAARKKGYSYVAITDHSKSLGVAGGLSVEDLERQIQEIRTLNRRSPKFRILAGTEVDIRMDGSLDYRDAMLAKLDFVVASVHGGFKQDRATMSGRIIRAMQNPHVRVIGHPTGRLLGDRDGYDVDFDAVMKEAAKTRTCLEVNAHFNRLDLNDVLCRKAREMGVHLIISTDAHNFENLNNLPYGIATAQRGWIEKTQVLNARPVEELLSFKQGAAV